MTGQRAVVLGTGRTAAPVAACFADAGFEVAIAGRDEGRAAEAVARAGRARVRLGQIDAATLAAADVVIETVVEDAAAKRALYGAIEPWLPAAALLLTNTSGLPITDLASGLARPERFAGFHFLHPADETGVVEIIPGLRTEPETIDRLRVVAQAMRKTPVVATRDVPGFIWNRLQYALLRECLHLIDEGVADAATIDTAISEGLAPRWLATGPLATVDLGGIATFRRIAADLFPHLCNDVEPPGAFDLAVERGGFYDWDAEAVSTIAALRHETLRYGREVGPRRRGSTPGS